jgi:hypothetical protein
MGKKGAGKAGGKKARVIEEIRLYPKVDLPKITEGWIRLEVRCVLWDFATIQYILKTDVTIDKLLRKIENSFGRVEKITLYVAQPPEPPLPIPPHYEITDTTQTLGNLLQTYGSDSKESPEPHKLYYDFAPYNPKDPVLLAI